jgi:hypothetical protein
MARNRRATATPLDLVSIADQVAGDLIPGESFGDLLRDPFSSRVTRHVDPDKLAPSQPAIAERRDEPLSFS